MGWFLPVRVRVKNFQSIEDAEVIIDGFVVVCGPNNSGKTALMRAIRGLFTNAAPGSYLRQGANFLSVEMEFDDGTTILWEKGWEKPEKKGSAVNRYTLNGYQLSSVGRGAPPEIEALGVQSILAGNTPIWPQVADQFDGTLFLVNKTGAMVAEALSDVERVGRLTDSLRLSEKDKRAVVSELKVRREDLKGLHAEVQRFQGLDRVKSQIKNLVDLKEEASSLGSQKDTAKGLQVRWVKSKSDWDSLREYSVEVPSEPKGIRDLPQKIRSVMGYRDRLKALQRALSEVEKFSPPQIGTRKVTELRDTLASARGFSDKLKRLQNICEALSGAQPLEFPDNPKLERIPKVLTTVRNYRERKSELESTLSATLSEQKSIQTKIVENEVLVNNLLGTRGYCPTCKTVHKGGHQ